MTSPKTVVNESDTVARPPAQKRLVKIAALDYPKGQMHDPSPPLELGIPGKG